MSYKTRNKLRYKHRLKGLSEDWVFNDNYNNKVLYQSLAYGTYIFEVVAINEDGVESAQKAQVVIIIQAAFWQTW
ncbi:MAG: hypothetical protein GY810_19335 [Aureispira sp.]|nr:hypothetical protein [Aureispira sp.]